MDLGDLLILLLFLFPVLSRLFGKKKPEPQRKRPLPSPDGADDWQSPTMEDPLGEALRQIREALGETEPEPEPLPQSPPPVSPPREFAPPVRGTKRPTEFREIGVYEHEEHGFGRSNPISEEMFERRPAFKGSGTTDRIKQKPLESVDLSTPIEVKKVAGPGAQKSRADVLRDPARAREAFIMKEVLGPPRSRGRRR